MAPGVIDTFESIERTWNSGCSIGASYQVIVDELDVETFAAASVADATTVFASSVVSSGVRLAPICASAVAMPVKMLPMSAIVPLDVLPVNGMRMP